MAHLLDTPDPTASRAYLQLSGGGAAIPQRDFLSVVNALSVFGLSPSQPSEQIRIRLQPRTFLGALTYQCSSVTSGGLMTPRSQRSFQERDDCSRAAQILAGKPLIRGSL